MQFGEGDGNTGTLRPKRKSYFTLFHHFVETSRYNKTNEESILLEFSVEGKRAKPM